LVKYLSEEGNNVPFKAAISYGNPFDLLGTSTCYKRIDITIVF